jgi:hypothetical protein
MLIEVLRSFSHCHFSQANTGIVLSVRPLPFHFTSYLTHYLLIILLLDADEDEAEGACGTHGRGQESVQGFGKKARRKETTWKTKA